MENLQQFDENVIPILFLFLKSHMIQISVISSIK